MPDAADHQRDGVKAGGEGLEEARRKNRDRAHRGALDYCLSVPKDDPLRPEADCLRGFALAQMRRPQEARAALLEAEEKYDLLSKRALADLGIAWFALGNVERAEEVLDQSILDAPDNGYGQARLGILHFSARRFGKALGPLLAGHRLLPDEPIFAVNLAVAYLRLKRPARALKVLPEDAGPAKQLALETRLDALSALNRGDEFQALIDDIERKQNDDVVSLRILAKYHAQSGRHDEAYYCFQRALRKEPGDVDTLAEAAAFASSIGRRGEAARHLARACQLAPQDPMVLVSFAEVFLVGAGEAPPRARKAVEKALALTEGMTGLDRASALVTAAKIAAGDGDSEKALGYFDRALALDGEFPTALIAKGHHLLQIGRVDEAVAAFEKAGEKAPVMGFGSLVSARVFPEDEETLHKIARMAEQPTMVGGVRSGVFFNLASAWEKRGDYERAFEAATRANQATRAILKYSAKANREQTRRIMEVFTPAFFAKRQGWGHPSRRPVFIVGMPRSGTTLLEQIIASHPKAFGAGELGLVGGQIQTMVQGERMMGSPLIFPECVRLQGPEAWKNLGAKHLRELKEINAEAERIVDKLPHNFRNVGLIHMMFPNAVILHSQRDVRDIAVSNYFTDFAAKFGGMGFCYDLTDLGRHMADYLAIMEHWHKVLPGRILDVPYEEVVEDTEGVARRVLAHVGLEWEEDVLDFHQLERPVKTASVWQVRQPIYKTSKEKWRRYETQLGPFQAALNEGFVEIVHD